MHTYYELKDMLKKELDQIVKKGELSAGSLETIDKLLNSIKNACKITMYEEYAEDGYSYADSDMDMSNYSYARGGNGRGRGSNANRDSMGRYSSEGGYSREGGYSNARDGRGGYSRRGYSYGDGEKEEKVQMLREMMNEVSSEDERRALKQIIRRMEQE
jgi:small nuclear ribonucleoprotein (snRNP)-like protein